MPTYPWRVKRGPSPSHPGALDLIGWPDKPIRGTPIYSPINVEKCYVKESRRLWGSYGNLVKLHVPDINNRLYYAHLLDRTVSAGRWIGGGVLLGHIDSTGNSTGDHLHFEVRNAPGQGYGNPWYWAQFIWEADMTEEQVRAIVKEMFGSGADDPNAIARLKVLADAMRNEEVTPNAIVDHVKQG